MALIHILATGMFLFCPNFLILHKATRPLESETECGGNLRGVTRAIEKFKLKTTDLVTGLNAIGKRYNHLHYAPNYQRNPQRYVPNIGRIEFPYLLVA